MVVSRGCPWVSTRGWCGSIDHFEDLAVTNFAAIPDVEGGAWLRDADGLLGQKWITTGLFRPGVNRTSLLVVTTPPSVISDS
ncbi:MAG TPA: hypothetical protein VGJ60_02305, partial [Chloroflexota bacterium]